MSRFENVARTARDEARSRRSVLIVTRTSHQAVKVMKALEDALRPRDGVSQTMNSNGLWAARADGWGEGRIEVRTQGAAIRGMSADTVLCQRDVNRVTLRDTWPVTATSAAPMLAVW